MTVCAACNGEGWVTVGGYSVSPFSGVRVLDPQEAHDERCDECCGSGRRMTLYAAHPREAAT